MKIKRPDYREMLVTLTADLFLQNIAKGFKTAIQKHPSGFTFNIINLQLKTAFSPEIYLVGQREHGKNFKTDPKLSDLIEWLCINLSAIYSKGGLIGGWWNKDGIFFLDVVAVISGYENAMLAGMINGEEKIYHPYSSRCIDVQTPQINIYLPEKQKAKLKKDKRRRK